MVNILSTSPLYQTPAMPAGSGPDFVNGVARIGSSLGAEALLVTLHRVERALGRVRLTRWGARTVDLDLLAAGAEVRPDAATERAWRTLPAEAAADRVPDRLILPHPRMAERAFVLVPLAMMAPDWRHPVLQRTARELAAALPPAERAAVRPLKLDPVVLRRAEADGRRFEIVRHWGSEGVASRETNRAVAHVAYRHLAAALADFRRRFGRLDWQAPLVDALQTDARNA